MNSQADKEAVAVLEQLRAALEGIGTLDQWEPICGEYVRVTHGPNDTLGGNIVCDIRTLGVLNHYAIADLIATANPANIAALLSHVEAQEARIVEMIEAAEELLSNEEHAVSGGMRSYQKGSPTWQLWQNLRAAISKEQQS